MCMFCHGVFKTLFGDNQISCIFIQAMRLVVVLLNAMPLYLMNFELMEWQDNKTDTTTMKYLFNIFVALTLISYFKASLLKPVVIP
jgi:hypothetical protein